jgi:hypothetical protein
MPAFKLMLPDLPAASRDLLTQWWQDARIGNPQAKSVTVTVQASVSQVPIDALTITMVGSHILGLNGGVEAAPYIVINPGGMRVLSQSMNVTRYLDLALPSLPSPTFDFGPSQSLLLHRVSGGDESLNTQEYGDLQVTVLALQTTAIANFSHFLAIGTWLDQMLLSNFASAQQVTFTKIGLHGVEEGQQERSVLPVRVNLINPLLVSDGTAPYVWDLVLRVMPVF